ncbi:MAG TPA: pseudouridine synthase [Methanocorpusculum sp.]|nr:pseudouridine synthase [Methanocorpusculum sp.]
MSLLPVSLQRVRRIADFQFGRGAGEALFPDETTFSYSNTKRIRYASLGKIRLVTVRAGDGRLTLGYPAAKRLHIFLAAPKNRVVVMNDAVPFILSGKNAMAKHVIASDPNIMAGDEVFVVDIDDNLLATGMAVLAGTEMICFSYGTAVKVRQGKNMI